MFTPAILALAATTASIPAQPADVEAARTIMAQCEGKDDFSAPAPPARIFGNVWYVGSCTVSVLLITGPEGHILIDAGMEDAVPDVLANIRKLGFDPQDVSVIVSSHEHFDHVGGLAALAKATGAKVVALPAAAKVIRTGRASPADPQIQEIHGFTPAKVDRVIQPGKQVRVGPIRLTAIATPGHTEGSTSWTWTSCEGADCRKITYVDSISALQLGTYRFRQHPDRVAMFRRTFDKVAAMDCGILLTPHPGSSAMFERMSGQQRLDDPAACKTLVEGARTRLNKALEQ